MATPANQGRQQMRSSSANLAWAKALQNVAALDRGSTETLPRVIEHIAEACPDAIAVIGERETLTYRVLVERMHQYADWADGKLGSRVGLMMKNSPEYLAIWLGLCSTGRVVALLNTNLTGTILQHSCEIAATTDIITGLEFVNRDIPRSNTVWVHDQYFVYNFRQQSKPVTNTFPALRDLALLLYTSGTTGKPKAVRITHHRILAWSQWFAGMMQAGPQDRIYDCLPLYHSVGGIVAPGALLVSGGSVVIREKFSASRFWADVIATESTIFQYIGELCRYLVNNTQTPKKHPLRLAVGNGLRSDVWTKFRDRFQIPQILEFYAATESNFSLYNVEEEPGAIGRIPPYLQHRFQIKIIKLKDGEPARDSNGFCIECGPDEAGEIIAKISNASIFDGYTDIGETRKKIIYDVFETNDAWYRGGDLIKKDARGFFYFVDRIGDTFRWKGENVSTTEVEEVLCQFPGVRDAVVYGVTVPDSDGRAGMAAIVVDDQFNLDLLQDHLKLLPEYARPLYLRICRQIDTTGTFKHTRQQFIRDGYDAAATDDPVYQSRMGAWERLSDPI
jgi:fatty-acyl-CoA synthase